jgi:hypothetical protein
MSARNKFIYKVIALKFFEFSGNKNQRFCRNVRPFQIFFIPADVTLPNKSVTLIAHRAN